MDGEGPLWGLSCHPWGVLGREHCLRLDCLHMRVTCPHCATCRISTHTCMWSLRCMTCVCETDRREDFYEVWSAVSDWVSLSRVTVPSSYVEVAPPSGQEPLWTPRDSWQRSVTPLALPVCPAWSGRSDLVQSSSWSRAAALPGPPSAALPGEEAHLAHLSRLLTGVPSSPLGLPPSTADRQPGPSGSATILLRSLHCPISESPGPALLLHPQCPS